MTGAPIQPIAPSQRATPTAAGLAALMNRGGVGGSLRKAGQPAAPAAKPGQGLWEDEEGAGAAPGSLWDDNAAPAAGTTTVLERAPLLPGRSHAQAPVGGAAPPAPPITHRVAQEAAPAAPAPAAARTPPAPAKALAAANNAALGHAAPPRAEAAPAGKMSLAELAKQRQRLAEAERANRSKRERGNEALAESYGGAGLTRNVTDGNGKESLKLLGAMLKLKKKV
jgi:hypothetical protein